MTPLSTHPLSIPVLMLAGVMFYVGLSHTLIWRRRGRRPLDALFAMACYTMGLYDIFSAGLYSADCPCEGAIWQQAQVSSLAYMSMFLFWFVAAYTEAIGRRVRLVFLTSFALIGTLSAFFAKLVVHADIHMVRHVYLPYGLEVVYQECAPGPLMMAQIVVGVMALIIALTAAYRVYRRSPRHRARRLGEALVIYAIGSLNDAAVGSGLYSGLYLQEYCFFAIAAAMAAALSRELGEYEASRLLLVETEKRFQSVFKNVAVGIAITRADGTLVRANSALGAMLCRHPSELMGTPLFDFLHPDDGQAVAASLRDLTAGDIAAYRDERRYIQPGGDEQWVDISAGVIRGESGAVEAVTWVLIGITDRRRAVMSLQRINEQLEGRITERTHELTDSNRRLSAMIEKLREDERAAQMIQYSLLPQPQRRFGLLEFSRVLHSSALMSGDFVDFFQIDGDRAGFYAADVSGHGVSSAFVTVLLKGFFGRLIDAFQRTGDATILDPEAVLTRLNSELTRADIGKHVTIIYGVADTGGSRIRLGTGGHFPHPLLFHDGRTESVDVKGTAIGLFEDGRFGCVELNLEGDFLLAIVSDGILEVLPQKGLRDRQAYLATLVDSLDVGAEELVRRVGREAVLEPPDDISILLVKRRTGSG